MNELVLPDLDQRSEAQLRATDYATRLCSALLDSFEDMLVSIRKEYSPFVGIRIGQSIWALHKHIESNPEKLQSFLHAPKDFKLLGREKYPEEEMDAFGEELLTTISLQVYNHTLKVDFYHGHPAMRLLSAVSLTANTIQVEAEMRAHELLQGHTTKEQYDMYLLTGTLLHRSESSKRLYLIRRGFPTLVYSLHEKSTGEEHHRFEVGLCAHGGGYHKGTFAGHLCPTDDVITHLLSLRADEDGFWKKSNIHLPTSGLLGL